MQPRFDIGQVLKYFPQGILVGAWSLQYHRTSTFFFFMVSVLLAMALNFYSLSVVTRKISHSIFHGVLVAMFLLYMFIQFQPFSDDAVRSVLIFSVLTIVLSIVVFRIFYRLRNDKVWYLFLILLVYFSYVVFESMRGKRDGPPKNRRKIVYDRFRKGAFESYKRSWDDLSVSCSKARLSDTKLVKVVELFLSNQARVDKEGKLTQTRIGKNDDEFDWFMRSLTDYFDGTRKFKNSPIERILKTCKNDGGFQTFNDLFNSISMDEKFNNLFYISPSELTTNPYYSANGMFWNQFANSPSSIFLAVESVNFLLSPLIILLAMSSEILIY